GVGPKPDANELLPLMEAMTGQVVPDTMLLDAGYDSENNHELLREYLEIDSIIPPKIGRPTDKPPAGKWRWLMATDFDPDDVYGQRWQVETVMRMIKAGQGEALTARSDKTRSLELKLMVLAQNLMVVLYLYHRGFLQSTPDPFFLPDTNARSAARSSGTTTRNARGSRPMRKRESAGQPTVGRAAHTRCIEGMRGEKFSRSRRLARVAGLGLAHRLRARRGRSVLR
ncbi:MAG: transposase, partial [Phycisphaeraceae bacterium]